MGSYWLELESPGNHPTRVAGLVPIASGQTLKLHFTFDEDGYVYLIGSGRQYKSADGFFDLKAARRVRLDDEPGKKGADFSFPSGSNWLSLDKNPGTDTFKVIFSKTPLTAPAFLNQAVTLEPLTPAQLTELSQFEGKYKDSKTLVELDESNKQAPSMRIKVAPDYLNNPIVFDIRIQHK